MLSEIPIIPTTQLRGETELGHQLKATQTRLMAYLMNTQDKVPRTASRFRPTPIEPSTCLKILCGLVLAGEA